MRVMLLPNEPPEHAWFQQTGPRDAFAHLQKLGAIDALEVVSFMRERARHASQSEFEEELLASIVEFSPDVLFLQHIGQTQFSANFWEVVKGAGTLLVYHEGDAFGLPLKRPSSDLVRVLRAADLVFTCALGAQRRLFTRLGARRVEYLPHFVDTQAFDTPIASSEDKTCDVIQVGNNGRVTTMLPVYFPGGRRREQLALQMRRRFGDRFRLFGRGWPREIRSEGGLAFFEQTREIRKSWISVNWDHFDGHAYYFSDRLPISLFSGTPHVTNAHPGYENIFGDCQGLYFCPTLTDLVDCTTWLLSRPREQLLAEGLAAKLWVSENLSARAVFAGAFARIVDEHKRLRLCSA